MLTKEEFRQLLTHGPCLLDGATGSNLRLAGMPRACCTEQWVLEHPQILQQLQRGYAEAGSKIIYASTFQAQPIALERVGLAERCELVNAELLQITREAAPGCLIAGDLTTLSSFCDSWDAANFDLMTENYRRQIRGLVDGGADLLAAETLLYEQEAEAILAAAEMEGAGAILFSFTMQSGGYLFNGQDAGPVLQNLENWGADAVGFNCVAADEMTPHLVSRLRRFTSLPLVCKPNAGNPVINAQGIAEYDLPADVFAQIVRRCADNGAALLGGCCGTTPEHIAAVRRYLGTEMVSPS